jgi:hypothetical protein
MPHISPLIQLGVTAMVGKVPFAAYAKGANAQELREARPAVIPRFSEVLALKILLDIDK